MIKNIKKFLIIMLLLFFAYIILSEEFGPLDFSGQSLFRVFMVILIVIIIVIYIFAEKFDKIYTERSAMKYQLKKERIRQENELKQQEMKLLNQKLKQKRIQKNRNIKRNYDEVDGWDDY